MVLFKAILNIVLKSFFILTKYHEKLLSLIKNFNLSFINKIILAHSSLLHHFHSNIRCPLPLPPAHHSKLTAAQLLEQGQLCWVNFPLAVTKAGCGRFGTAWW